MNRGRLSVGDSGDAVTRLHEELGRRGLEMPTEEVRRKLFGPATRQALQAWQRDNALASGHEKIRVCGQLAPGSRPSFLQSCGH